MRRPTKKHKQIRHQLQLLDWVPSPAMDARTAAALPASGTGVLSEGLGCCFKIGRPDRTRGFRPSRFGRWNCFAAPAPELRLW